MNALILGGTGFIGTRLAGELAGRGHEVTVFARGNRADRLDRSVRRLPGDRRSEEDLTTAFSAGRFDVVFDLLCYDAHDAERIVRVAGRGLARRIVHVSTCSVYWCTGDFPCPVPEEDFDRLDTFEESPGAIEYAYGYAKRAAERRLMRAHREGDLEVTIVRPPCVAGEEDPTMRYASYCERVSDGRPLILPDGGFVPFRHVYVGDLAAAIARIADRDAAAGRAYNLASPEILSVRRIVDDIAALLGARPEIVEIPGPVLRTFSSGAPDATAFSPFTQRAAQVPDVSRAVAEIGWSPEPYARWIESTVRWWRDVAAAQGRRSPAARHRDRELEWIRIWRERVRF